jgi:hypothetical protein
MSSARGFMCRDPDVVLVTDTTIDAMATFIPFLRSKRLNI